MKCLASTILTFAAMAMCSGGAVASPERDGVTVQYPTVSASGRELAFAADFDGNAHIWVAGTDGSHLRRVSSLDPNSPTQFELHPTWSPDGRQLAYEGWDGEKADIWVMQANGAYPVKLTSNGASNTDPSWSPDGRTIAFISARDAAKDLWLMNADGSRQRKLVSSNLYSNDSSFSPDGQQLVLSQTDGDSSSIAIVNVDGSGFRVLTSGNFRDWNPNWGAQGIVFSSNRGSHGARNLWVIQPNGTGLHSLGNFEGLDPVWLPDGNLVYVDEDMRYSKALSSISIADLSTGTRRVLIDVQGYMTPIDVRPGNSLNQVNPRSNGRMRVAILSTRNFDAPKSVDRNALTFGRTGAENSLSSCSKRGIDVNGDGIPDLVCRFDLRMTGFRMGDTTGVLRFNDSNGKPYEGRDAITTVTVDDPDDLKH